MNGAEGSGRLASVHIYPLKAGRAVDLGESVVEPWGLAGDRRWLVIDGHGRFVSQREEPSLALVTAAYPAPGTDHAGPQPWPPADVITLSAAGQPPLTVRAPSAGDQAEMVLVAVWKSRFCAAAAGKQADGWLSHFLDRNVRLVYLDDPTRREVDQDYGAPGDRVNFADGYPLLLTSTGSLQALGRWLTDDGHEPVPMSRFRPNVVVDGTPPWAEDRWRRIRIGSVIFRVVKPCGRCQVTTIDQATAERGRQPLALLGQRRRFGQQLVFGQNMIPDGAGSIRVGDPVQVLERSGALFLPPETASRTARDYF
ncbi:MAG: MOSC domain-containing protein [Streptosporangiaceae bacterium]